MIDNTLKVLAILCVLFTSCEIVQETKFERDGGGEYSVGFDISMLMKMGGTDDADKQDKNKENGDTTIVFAEYLELKKDSIAQLEKSEQEKLKKLENYSLHLVKNDEREEFRMKISYLFDDVSELELFSENLDGQQVKELEMVSDKTAGMKQGSDITDFYKSYTTTFDKRGFSLELKPEVLKKAESMRDSSATKDNPMANVIKLKSRFLFPYRIKQVSNPNAIVMPDFKGIEITGNLLQISENPRFFDTEVLFE